MDLTKPLTFMTEEQVRKMSERVDALVAEKDARIAELEADRERFRRLLGYVTYPLERAVATSGLRDASSPTNIDVAWTTSIGVAREIIDAARGDDDDD